jgi:hypothetical protein
MIPRVAAHAQPAALRASTQIACGGTNFLITPRFMRDEYSCEEQIHPEWALSRRKAEHMHRTLQRLRQYLQEGYAALAFARPSDRFYPGQTSA